MKHTDTMISVILPVQNASAFLRASLESILKQTHRNLEVIAIDDNSKDGSYEILKDFKKKDGRIRIFRNKKRYGLAVCFNRAMRHVQGRFVTFMSPHDVNTLYRFSRQINFLLQHPKMVGVGSQTVFVTQSDKKIGKSDFPINPRAIREKILTGLSLQFETVLLNKYLLPKDLLHFRTNAYPFLYSEVFLKLIQYGPIANLKQYLYFHRDLTIARYRTLTGFDHHFSHIKLFVRSLASYDYRPSLRGIFARALINTER